MNDKRNVTITSALMKVTGIELVTLEEGIIKLNNEKYDTSGLYQKIMPSLSGGGRIKININKYLRDVEPEITGVGLIRFVKKAFYTVKNFFTNSAGEQESTDEVIHEATTVAMVGEVEIPQVDKIQHIVNHAHKRGNTVGVENLLKRLAAMKETRRGRVVSDLMKFLEKADLPITDSGDIIAYKSLRKGTGSETGMFVDHHSGKVPQDVGSLVFMDIKDVDDNNKNECSQGLHIARVGYLKGFFKGDAYMVIKVRPEDIVAVPAYDANKMRVAAYHVVGQLTSAGANAIYDGKGITGIERDEQTVAEILAGKHVGIIHRVHIGGPKGTRLTITGENPDGKKTIKEVGKPEVQKEITVAKEQPKAEPVVKSTAKPKKLPVPKYEPLPKTGTPVKAAPVHKQTNAERAKQLYETMQTSTNVEHIEAARTELLALKKKTKVSWQRLGIPIEAGKVLETKGYVAMAKTSIVVTTIDEAAPIEKNDIAKAVNMKQSDKLKLAVQMYDKGDSITAISKAIGVSRNKARSMISTKRKLR